MHEPKHNTLWLALQLVRLWLRGWAQVPGYTVCRTETCGDVYIAVQLEKVR